MAVGVYNRPNHPRGPDLDKYKYTINPTRTGGRPINAFIIARRGFLIEKRLMANIVPIGMPITHAIAKDEKDTIKDRASISIRSLSKFRMSQKE
jgi:hypothetical protein